jgi:hypothetical protein
MKLNVIKLRIFLWSLSGLVVLWLLYMAIVPNGKITYVQNFSGNNFFIQKLTPAERVEPIRNGTQKIVGNPVYFSLRTPRRFDSAKVEIKYKNNSDLPIIETGVLADKTVWRYDTTPIENNIIDQLAATWYVTGKGDTVLLQRQKRYNNVNDFLKKLPPQNEIALYNYDLQNKYLLPNYEPNDEGLATNYVLRGSYQFYTYIKNEELNFKLSFVDLNINKDKDPIDVYVYSDNKAIAAKRIEDNDIPENSNIVSAVKNLEFKINGLSEGVYKIEVKVNDDIATKKIETKQSKIAFINSVRLVDSNKSNIIMYTDSTQVSVQTINPSKLQTIFVNGKKTELNETYKQVDLVIGNNPVKEIKLAKDDVTLSGDGVFSFNRDELVNSNFKKINSKIDIDSSGINYILVDYHPSMQEGEWKMNTAKIDLGRAYREFNKYSFIVSIPGLKADDGINDNVEVDEIKVELEGTSLWEKIAKIFNF